MAVEANKVSIKIPPFWPEKPEIWFYQVEAQFEINGITTELTKFNYLVSQLEPKYIEDIWDLVNDKNATNKYTTAKERLLSVFRECENRRIKRLVTGIELGDVRPSQLLQKMRSLATEDISDKVLGTLWLDKMPDYIKNILLVLDESLVKLASMADKIGEMNPRRELCTTSQGTSLMEELMRKMADLELQVAQLGASRLPRPRNRSTDRGASSTKFRNRRRSGIRKRCDPKGKYCYYHFRFGAGCIPDKCTSPCAWSQKPTGNVSPQPN
ncbi:uncharacterized protein LOC123987898 [Osmia bicornis bicornis]|uniref:uncharacterized protein LOC123987898 n=1 Tax=Osmia bicornis bicornis TaxID=1437191 RepID=UPI001EAEB9EB|nr:uncharacterized protein LOC123987898 [Osmia bicornis bicornis]